MRRPICVKCEIEMRPEENDVRVINWFSLPPEPDTIWCADVWKCPICGVKIVCGFGHAAYAYHYQEGFEQSLENARGNYTVVNNYEKGKPSGN